ncbi:MOSC domain-containing protein [Corynebacterium breve]|uniref:MOSC domain-containing protein n=1 Tax=Corynebacterium breve TaxID=3049799 RepID=A0ABY8VEU3_9CORY|nr:MOSC domain-containing protein [Corynebacterium breve]WIM68186.1 MOSC domain-containing protein [Corynebacterium breve]
MRILSTNVAVARLDPGGAERVSGIDKRPVARLVVDKPGPNYGDGSGVAGDTVGDTEHHGGEHKAVYAFSRERLDWWERKLDRSFACGSFGENLTTTGIDLAELLINQRIAVGSTVLEVSVPRSPCRTFAGWIGVDKWQKRFTASGDCGAYFRVIQPGEIVAGDGLELLDRPDHGITMGMAFRAKMGDQELARKVWEARILPPMLQHRLDRRFG